MNRIVIDLNPDMTHAAVSTRGITCWGDVFPVLFALLSGKLKLVSFQAEYSLPSSISEEPPNVLQSNAAAGGQ